MNKRWQLNLGRAQYAGSGGERYNVREQMAVYFTLLECVLCKILWLVGPTMVARGVWQLCGSSASAQPRLVACDVIFAVWDV